MTDKTEDPAAALAGSLRKVAAGDSALAESLTPIERVLIAITPILIAFDRVRSEAEAGHMSPAGVFRKAEPSPIEVPGAPERVELIGIKLPIAYVQEIVDAHAAARATPYGKRLSDKILAFSKTANAKPD